MVFWGETVSMVCITVTVTVRHVETDLSTKETQACTDPRISRAASHVRRTSDRTRPQTKGPRKTDRLTPFVFPRYKRLPRAQFPVVFKNGRRHTSPHFTAVISHKAQGYAVVIPKKIARLAVTRHRIKRRVLAALRTIPLPPALLLFPKASVSSVSYEDIKTEIKTLLS